MRKHRRLLSMLVAVLFSILFNWPFYFSARIVVVADGGYGNSSFNGSTKSGSNSAPSTAPLFPQPDSSFVQVVETEVWDASKKAWKGGTGLSDGQQDRWANEKGEESPSPSEIKAPDGYDFMGDWKIVIDNKKHDAMGWEYLFHYLRPPTRRRIWLRSLQPSGRIPASSKSPLTRTTTTGVSILESPKSILQRIRDDWNFKGYGISVYKSFIFPESFGIGVGLPLSVNFEYCDSRPELPSVTCGAALFFPWTVMGYLSASVHVEWIIWILQSALALVPRLVLWVMYKLLLPVLWMVAAAVLLPIRHRFQSVPPTIPKGFWTIAKPKYSSEISERIGCSASYRWSQQGGYEFRVSYSHSYLRTFQVYQQIISRSHQKFQTLQRRAKRLYVSQTTKEIKNNQPNFSRGTNDWLQKHFARLGISTGYPIPSPPHFSCSAILSLSGLYFKKQPLTASRSTTASDWSSNMLDTTSTTWEEDGLSASGIRTEGNGTSAKEDAMGDSDKESSLKLSAKATAQPIFSK